MLTDKTGMIIAAGGSSRRFGGDKNKLLCEYDHKPLFVHCLETYSPLIKKGYLIVAAPAELIEEMRSAAEEYLPGNHIIWTSGGKTRVHSAAKALQLLPEDTDLVAIHDAARPLATADLLAELCRAAAVYGGAIPGAIPTDTIKTVDENNLIIGNPVRSNLAAVATPQVFDFKCYKAAVEALPPEVANGEKEDPSLTDDAAIFFRHNHQIKVIFSDLPNHKITYMNDLHK